ncbi:uncharacterized protein LOC135074576 [Ostrinia nubilalis]|uniref:uncharacterized protein LOC135074576 n=1 Tax=Ostrinia nubilalis TaxID=29057 RepID=UPI003082635E
MPKVRLTVVPSPALGLGATVISATDTLSTVANIGALAGVVGALAAPAIAPVALSAAMVVGVATGSYAIVRSSITLADRNKHEQSIGLENSEARASWINILVSSVGMSCSAAGKLLSWAAESGTNVKILMNAVQFLQYANLGSGCIGVANSLGDMIYKYNKYDETPTGLEIFQFTTSALFLGIGVMSNRTAQDIVQDAQADTINKMRDDLSSNAKKKMFDKMSAETRRVKGMVQGNADVIQAVKNIENPDEFFAKLARINKQLNKNKLRISLSPDGQPLINNNYKVGVGDLQALGKQGRDQLFAKYGPANVNTKNAPTRVYASNSSANSSSLSQQNTSWTVRPEEIIKITTFLINLSKIDQDQVAEIISILSADIHDAFLLLCAEMIASLIPAEIKKLLALDSHFKIRIILFIFNYIRSQISVDDPNSNLSFANILKEYVREGRINKFTLLRLKKKLMEKVDKYKTDPRLFDDMHSFRNTYNSSELSTIRTGEVLKIGAHEILIKNNTTEKLEEYLEMYSQSQCDKFLSLCFGLISSLSKTELQSLNKINPDEDAVLQVSYFLVHETEGILFDFLIEESMETELLLEDMIVSLKDDLMRWCYKQRVRPHKTCEVCKGIRYT